MFCFSYFQILKKTNNDECIQLCYQFFASLAFGVGICPPHSSKRRWSVRKQATHSPVRPQCCCPSSRGKTSASCWGPGARACGAFWACVAAERGATRAPRWAKSETTPPPSPLHRTTAVISDTWRLQQLDCGSDRDSPCMGGVGTSWFGSIGTLGLRVSNSSWLMTFNFLKFSTSGWTQQDIDSRHTISTTSRIHQFHLRGTNSQGLAGFTF